MWLLSTDRAELHEFIGPEAAEGGYAILSHVWDRAGEQSFKDLKRLRKRCDVSGENPRDLVCDKIRECCLLAERHGFKWVWIDTCCIDKASSSELSEAINSMYRYYAFSRICYAYLADVPTQEAHTYTFYEHHSPFQNSRWYKRGWTLQELIASPFLLFLSSSWDILGSKHDLAPEVEEASLIPAAVLRMEKSAHEFSVCQRMSWASRRITTRPEDEAYCLLGIFDVNMSTLYGEGRKAFRRLQEEIMRRSSDTTLFAWRDGSDELQNPLYERRCSRASLFATTPVSFSGGICRSIRYKASEVPSYYYGSHNGSMSTQARALLRIPGSEEIKQGPPRAFRLVPDCILAEVPLAYSGELDRWYADMSWYCDFPPVGDRPDEKFDVFLLLAKDRSDHDPIRPLFSCRDVWRGHRPVGEFVWTWTKIRLMDDQAASESRQNSKHPVAFMSMNGHLEPPFRIDPSYIQMDGFGSIEGPVMLPGGEVAIAMLLKPPWRLKLNTVIIILGQCGSQQGLRSNLLREYSGQLRRDHWVKLVTLHSSELREIPMEVYITSHVGHTIHDCHMDHISDHGSENVPVGNCKFERLLDLDATYGEHAHPCDWPKYSTKIWFTLCSISSGTTLIPHIQMLPEYNLSSVQWIIESDS